MTKVYEKGATRMYNDKQLEVWIKAEENLGLKNSIFFWENGKTTQWVDCDEAEKFLERVKLLDLNTIMSHYVEALERKDWIKVFECISIMEDAMEHLKLDEDIIRRWTRLRKSTHEEFYKLK